MISLFKLLNIIWLKFIDNFNLKFMEFLTLEIVMAAFDSTLLAKSR